MLAFLCRLLRALRYAGVLSAALVVAAEFSGCAGAPQKGAASGRSRTDVLLNVPELGREPGRQVPDGAIPGRISLSERIIVGKVMSVQWGTGNVSSMGAPGRAEVECVRAFRGAQAGQRIMVTVFKPLWRSYSDETLETSIFSNGGADVRPGDQWLFLLGGFEKSESANSSIPGETQVGALAYCPKGDVVSVVYWFWKPCPIPLITPASSALARTWPCLVTSRPFTPTFPVSSKIEPLILTSSAVPLWRTQASRSVRM